MKTILCYGDSNTYGYIYDGAGRYPREVRWTGILQKNLGSEYYVIEEGLVGRTTVWDDPVEEYKNGKKYLFPCLESHKPIDLVIIMLGTNDLKARFSVSPYEIGNSMENLVRTILKSDAGLCEKAPKILLVTPVPLHSVGRTKDLDQMIPDMGRRSRAIEPYYREIAERYGLAYLNPDGLVEVNDVDGMHYTENGHAQMAALMEKKVREIFE